MSYAVPGLGLSLLHPGASSPASARSLLPGIINPLPKDHWQVNVMQWWATYLGTWRGIQAGVVSTTSGPVDVLLEHLRIEPFVEWIQYRICDNKVSFPLLSLALGLVRDLGRTATCQELTCGTADHTQLRLYLLQPVWLILHTYMWAHDYHIRVIYGRCPAIFVRPLQPPRLFLTGVGVHGNAPAAADRFPERQVRDVVRLWVDSHNLTRPERSLAWRTCRLRTPWTRVWAKNRLPTRQPKQPRPVRRRCRHPEYQSLSPKRPRQGTHHQRRAGSAGYHSRSWKLQLVYQPNGARS